MLGLDGEHLLEQVVAGVDQVVAQQHREGLVADERSGLQHRVAQAPGLALADEVHLRDVGGGVHGVQPGLVALLLQRRLQLRGAVEEVLDGGLVAAGDHQHLGQPGAGGLLDDVLQRGAVDDRQQLLGHRLGRGQEAGAHPGDRDDGLGGRRRAGRAALVGRARHGASLAGRNSTGPPGATGEMVTASTPRTRGRPL